MSRHHDEHRSCEAVASTSQNRLQNEAENASQLNVLSDTDSGVADTEEVGRVSGRQRNTGTRPKSSQNATASTSTSASTSSNVDFQMLRDSSEAYEELNKIGTGKKWYYFFQDKITL